MKKYLFLWILFCLLLPAAVSARKVYITRHGQVNPKESFRKNKVRELALTGLGVTQAEALAKFLVEKQKFNGKIYVSPFYRTIQTGVTVAELLKTQVILEPGIQEIAPGVRPGKTMDLKTIQAFFPEMTVPGKRYQDPWRLFAEDGKARYNRVEKALNAILAEEKGDVLLVSHGGIVGNLVNVLNKRPASKQVQYTKGISWNCALFIFELDENDKKVKGVFTTEFMEDKNLTSNFRCPKIERPDDSRYERSSNAKQIKKKEKSK